MEGLLCCSVCVVYSPSYSTWTMGGKFFITHEKERLRQEQGLNQRPVTLSRAGKRWETLILPFRSIPRCWLALRRSEGPGQIQQNCQSCISAKQTQQKGPQPHLWTLFLPSAGKMARQVAAPQLWTRQEDRGIGKPGKTKQALANVLMLRRAHQLSGTAYRQNSMTSLVSEYCFPSTGS